jgi:hypothetical protein
VVVGPGKHAGQLHAAQIRLQPVQVGLDSRHHLVVRLGFGQLQQLQRVLDAGAQNSEGVDQLRQIGSFLLDGRRLLGVVPEVGLLDLAVDGLDAPAFASDVKEAPLAHPACLAGFPGAR